MVETASNPMPLGTKAPDFNLIDVSSNKFVSLQSLKSDIATVIMFICNHCPYVKHIQQKMTEVAKAYQQKQIQFIAISSNDVANYPQDGPAAMQRVVQEQHYTFPYLYDETQAVAKAYAAACTPEFYVFDKDLACVYHGRFDGATPGNTIPVTGKDLTDCLDNILSGKPVNPVQQVSLGCNIKWKK